MVGLVACLGIAVIYQSVQQVSILASISAYYYTPAQAIFVGAIIALGVCMIALQGPTAKEDVALNLGGMFAVVVAIVPTARSADFRTTVRACKDADSPLLTERALTELDCPTIQALEAAAKANVENNVVALLIVGALGLVATWLFARIDRESPRTGQGRRFRRGWLVACAVYVIGTVGYAAFTDRFIDMAHYLAAFGLFACIVVVVWMNWWRRFRATPTDSHHAHLAPVPDRYAVIGGTMLAVVAVGSCSSLSSGSASSGLKPL